MVKMRVRYPSSLWMLLFGAWLSIIVDQAEAAIAMWDTCKTNVSSSFHLPDNGGDYEAIGCRFSLSVTIVYMLILDNDTAVLISGGSVAAGVSAGLWIRLSPIDIPVGPLRLIVKDMSFGQDASFGLTGALPLRSYVHISNNTFYLTQRNLMNFNEHIYAIHISYTSIQLLDEGTTFEVLHNTVTARVLSGKVVVVYISFQLLTVRGGSTFSVCGNEVENSVVDSAFVVYLDMVNRETVSLVDGAVVNVNNNSARNVKANSVVYIVYVELGSVPLSLNSQSTIIMNGNSMINATSANGIVVYFDTSGNEALAISGQSSMIMNNNDVCDCSFQNMATVVCWSIVSNRVALDSNSAVIIRNNSIRDSRANSFIYLVQVTIAAHLSILGGTRIDFSQNAIMRCATLGSAYSVEVIITSASRCDLTNSFLTVNANFILSSHSNSVVGVVVLLIEGVDSLLIGNGAIVTVNTNNVINCSATTAYAIQFALPNCELSADSSVSMNENNVRDSRFDISATAVHFSTYAFSVRSNSTLDFASNTISNANVDVKASCVYLSIRSLSLQNQSTLTVSGNFFVNSEALTVDVVQLNILTFGGSDVGISLLNQSNLTLVGNSFWNSTSQLHSSTVSCQIIGAVALHAHSNIILDGNENNHSTIGRVYVAWLQLSRLSATKQSSVTMSGNTLGNSRTSGLAYVSFFSMNGGAALPNSLTLGYQSRIVMNHNSMWNGSIAGAAYAANIWLLGSNVSLSAQSTISMNGNSLQGCSLSFNAYVALINYVDLVGLSNNLTLSGSSVITMAFNSADKLLFPRVSLSLARIEASMIVLTNSSLEFRSNSLTDVFTSIVVCVEISADLSLYYSTVNVIGNTLSNVTTKARLFLLVNSPVYGESGSTLNIDRNKVRPDSRSTGFHLSPLLNLEPSIMLHISRSLVILFLISQRCFSRPS